MLPKVKGGQQPGHTRFCIASELRQRLLDWLRLVAARFDALYGRSAAVTMPCRQADFLKHPNKLIWFQSLHTPCRPLFVPALIDGIEEISIDHIQIDVFRKLKLSAIE